LDGGSAAAPEYPNLKKQKSCLIMVTGIVLVNVERSKINDVIKGLTNLQGVSEVYSVAGEYDLVAMIRVADNAELAEIVATRMTRDIDGILHTKTLVTLNAYSKVDLSKIFLTGN